MSASTIQPTPVAEAVDPDPFDLDIRVIESGHGAAALIDLTDDGCGSTCASPCATNFA